MLSLEYLADDAIGLILSFRPSAVFALWNCGSRALHAKIARKCRHFSICDKRGALTLSRWPPLLSRLPALEAVSIQVYAINETPFSLSSHIKKLPSTLKKLELYFRGDGRLLLDDLEDRGLVGNVHGRTPLSKLWRIKDCFPTLEVLHLGDPELALQHNKQPAARVTTDSLSIFPETLTSLRWSMALLTEEDDLSNLPRGLRSLEIKGGSFVDLLGPVQLRTLPPSLTHYHGAEIGARDAAAALSVLPCALESMQMRPIYLTPSNISLLPPGLTELRANIAENLFNAAGLHWEASLPPRLTKIQHFLSLTFAPSLLPRSVTSIEQMVSIPIARYLEATSREEIDRSWPPSLCDLHFYETEQLPSVEVLGKLPDRITSLRKVGTRDNRHWDACPLLPRSLTHLSFQEFEMEHLIDPDSLKIGSLPPGLTYLDAYADLPPSLYAELPRGLRTLKMKSTELKGDDLALALRGLPSTLTCLEFGGIHHSSFPLLPRSLLELGLDYVLGDGIDYSTLPPELECLSLRVLGDWGGSLTTLPPSLRVLRLNELQVAFRSFLGLSDRIRMASCKLNLHSADSTQEIFDSLSPHWKHYIYAEADLTRTNIIFQP